MAQTSAGRGPIPPANKEDPEDVAWALSTAEAMYARGDRNEALKWLRRAAEAAAENQTHDRSVQLAKAVADLAGMLGPATGAAAPSARSLAAAKDPPSSPAFKAPPLPSRPAAHRPEPPARGGLSPTPVRTAPSGAFRRAASVAPRVPKTDERPEPSSARALPVPAPRPPASTPVVDEPTPQVSMEAAPVPVTAPKPSVATSAHESSPVISRGPDVSAPDLVNDDLAEGPEEKTRIGVPAYQAGAMAAADGPSPAKVAEPSLRPTQAMRVIVWRAADGVHVAPHGTHVSAIAVDAVLVALDPSADLAAWLSKK
jgi:hypothetical protein